MANRVKTEVAGVVSALGGIYLSVSLFSYNGWDPSFFTYTEKPAGNWGGVVGSYIADFLISLFGFSAYVIPFFLVVYGIRRFFSFEKKRIHLIGAMLFVLSASILSGLVSTSLTLKIKAGGIFGSGTGDVLLGGLSTVGAYIFCLTLFFSSLILLSPLPVAELFTRKKPVLPFPADPPIAETPPAAEFPESLIPDEFPEKAFESPAQIRGNILAAAPPFEEDAVSWNDEGYELPGLEFLSSYDSAAKQPREELSAFTTLLERKLADYGVHGKVSQVHTGPVVTMYEFEPAPGVKINRVVSLSDDLALSLRAQSVRISPVPGKAAIGVEVPNRYRETVSLKEIISSDSFKKSQSKLTLALGKDIFGTPVVADLTRMPHLLVAGATGAGKSVFLNSIVVSILYKASPREVKMLMIDPKLLELSSYDGIPHLISPVITNPKEAAEMLRRMVLEMERRYRLIAEKGVRNIESFNAISKDEEKLAYIVVLIDELADLMFASASEVEDSIARLAQMARASGIHLVLATQRPSVDVITGVIKANFSARVAFHVTSKIDSRTIIDTQGAEQLIGKGDMLFMLPGMRLMRVHGALVTESEVKGIVDFISRQGAPDYSITEEHAREVEIKNDDERDDLYYKAIEFAKSVGEVSISSLQRRLKVGYNRAARLMELMEEDGLVGPPKGAGKPRDFLG